MPAAVTRSALDDGLLFRGPEFRRLTAEEFLDAVWQITGTGPKSPAGNLGVAPAPFTDATPPARRLVRAALVTADPLMRSLGRPNREQVVTTRPDQLTTLQALDLTNGAILTDTLSRGAANILKDTTGASPDRLADLVYRRALGRAPTAGELSVARDLLGPAPSADTLADLLWSVVMLPEFQIIR